MSNNHHLLMITGNHSMFRADSGPGIVIPTVKRSDFPKDFVFGAATSAYQDDVDLMKKLGLDSYRFSIAWTRILPGGRICKGICKEGIKYYNDLIDILLTAAMELVAHQG
ncbi:unnamed protein product [Fraxinus pennsylvanica]|uniref:Beta-glucosidase n=1 Tax=Fraxinus pennsylvanica TaxID=56036 RepID=A0AAD2A8C5_9LAMI|nr:unnamed protein product [Fraxinus pennsylvanica]